MIRRFLPGSLMIASLSLLSCSPDNTPGVSPDDSQLIPAALNLYNNLFSLADSAVLVGHQDALAYGMHWKGDEFRTDINDVCGDFPAIFGWDLGHIGDTTNIDGVPFDRMRRWAVAAYERGGIHSCTPDEYKALYRFTVDYLKKTRELHNILYAYSPDVFESPNEYLRFYPGDEYVDILGFDDYKGLRSRETSHRTVAMLEMLDRIANEKSKPMAITETGLENIPDPDWFTDVVLSTLKTNASTRRACWVLFWRNGRPDHFYAPCPGHTSAADFIKFKEDELTWFLSDIRDIYNKRGQEE